MASLTEVNSLPEPTKISLVIAVGFEARALGYAEAALRDGTRFHQVMVIEYLPLNPKNRRERALEIAKELSINPVVQVSFDRYFPADSEALFAESLSNFAADSRIVFDISGMSRFLICALVVRAIRARLAFGVVYTEPAEYHPTKAEVDQATSAPNDGADVMFLTTGVYGLAAVEDLTTATMQGYPEVLVASPTFEPRCLRALLSELSPAKFVLMEGVPREPYRWRRDVVRHLNSFAFETVSSCVPVSTDSIEEAAAALLNIYNAHKYSYRLVVAPAGSKLMAVGQAVAIGNGVQAEVIYPTPANFSDPYSDGVGTTRFWISNGLCLPLFGQILVRRSNFLRSTSGGCC